MTRSCYAFVFARGGSKGVKGKNKRLLGDKPLIAHSIETALACPSVSRVFVSTDSEDLAEIALSFGAEVPFIRPAELAQDNTPEWLAWQHAVKEITRLIGAFDYFVSLPPTSPLRDVSDVETCISRLTDDVDIVVSYTDAARNPYFNMVALDEEGYCRTVCPLPNGPTRRQDAPTVYDLTTVAYVTRPSYVLEARGVFEGRVKGYRVPHERAIDIDTELDFMMAELLLERRIRDA